MGLGYKNLSPPQKPRAYSSHPRHHAAPTQGRAGRLETGAPVWPLVEARQPRLQYSVLDTGPGEEAPDRDGRPLAP